MVGRRLLTGNSYGNHLGRSPLGESRLALSRSGPPYASGPSNTPPRNPRTCSIFVLTFSVKYVYCCTCTTIPLALPDPRQFPCRIPSAFHHAPLSCPSRVSWFPTVPTHHKEPLFWARSVRKHVFGEKLTATLPGQTIAECATTQSTADIRKLIHAIGLVTLIPCLASSHRERQP